MESWMRRLSSLETKLGATAVSFRLRTNLIFSLAYKLLACVVLQYLNGATIYVWKVVETNFLLGAFQGLSI